MRTFALLPLLALLALASPVPEPAPTAASKPTGTWSMKFFNDAGCSNKVAFGSNNAPLDCYYLGDGIKGWEASLDGWTLELYSDEDCQGRPPIIGYPQDLDHPNDSNVCFPVNATLPVKAYKIVADA